jgi:hypothetical protein
LRHIDRLGAITGNRNPMLLKIARRLTRRIAVNIAKLPELLKSK